LPVVKNHFHLVVFGIIGVSVLPIIYELWSSRRQPSQQGSAVPLTEPIRESA
jgi:hypothetical protein